MGTVVVMDGSGTQATPDPSYPAGTRPASKMRVASDGQPQGPAILSRTIGGPLPATILPMRVTATPAALASAANALASRSATVATIS